MVDMSRAILAMAEADGPTSVLAEVVAPLLQLEDVQLARVWFMEDQACRVCAQSRRAPGAGSLHMRASGGLGDTDAEIAGECHLIEVAVPRNSHLPRRAPRRDSQDLRISLDGVFDLSIPRRLRFGASWVIRCSSAGVSLEC